MIATGEETGIAVITDGIVTAKEEDEIAVAEATGIEAEATGIEEAAPENRRGTPTETRPDGTSADEDPEVTMGGMTAGVSAVNAAMSGPRPMKSASTSDKVWHTG